MKVEVVVAVIRKRLYASPAGIKVCDWELSRFLFVMLEDEEISAQGLEDQEMVGGDDFRTGARSKLNPPARTPTEEERKMMIALEMYLIVKKVMTNFLYTFR